MKIIETITPINAHKTIMGKQEIELVLETETGRVSLDAPAMFVDPIVPLEELQEAINKLSVHMEKANAQEDERAEDEVAQCDDRR